MSTAPRRLNGITATTSSSTGERVSCLERERSDSARPRRRLRSGRCDSCSARGVAAARSLPHRFEARGPPPDISSAGRVALGG